jgi:DNA-binding MarR family transcriptional regulator
VSRKPTATRVSSDAESFEAAASLREALRLFSRRSEEVTRRHGLTPRGYSLLLMIKTGSEQERATPDELERRLQLAKSTVAELLQRNEERGLVRRELHPDRRGAIVVALTRSGEQRLQKAFDELGSERERLVQLVRALENGG